ncbi:MAG: HNH endonuclease [Rhizobium sp.]|nr:HNH endonuclease [Rhizobium sp.]
MKRCLREPIDDIFVAADELAVASKALIEGDRLKAVALLNQANRPAIREWTESLWGARSPYAIVVQRASRPTLATLVAERMPIKSQQAALISRDGYHCRYCGIPLIRKEVRAHLSKLVPEATLWGRTNLSQHAAFQAMWLQFDHVVPHSHGGDNSLDNIIVCCAPCNFAKMAFTVAELDLEDPRLREPKRSDWSGLEEILRVEA